MAIGDSAMIDSLLLMNFLYLEIRSGGKIWGIGGGAEGLAWRGGGSMLLDMVVFKCLFDQLVGLLFSFSAVCGVVRCCIGGYDNL